MPSRNLLFTLAAVITALCLPATASAAFEHVVASGESLYSVAAADGLSVSQLAAANGLSPDSQLTAGSALAIPPQGEAVTAPVSSPGASPSSAGASPSSPSDASTAATAPSSGGGYQVQPGDTLSAIAARYGTTVDDLAATNGLDANGILPAGSSISVSGGSSATSSSSSAAGSPPTSSGAGQSGGPQPTPETVSPSDVGAIAAQNGVSPSLAEAIGQQESGFNNNEVSSTGATGVMQIEPGTWNYIGQTLGTQLSPTSATDNIRGGVVLLHSLLDQTGGDPAMAAAAYYQGLQSVREHGMYSDTQRYVNDVMALRRGFGGG